MTYPAGRRIVDADSHLMEWPGFLTDHAEPAFRDAMPPIGARADTEGVQLIRDWINSLSSCN